MKRACVVGNGRMGRIHARALRDLGFHVVTVDTNGQADLRVAPTAWQFDAVAIAVPIEHLAAEASKWQRFGGHLLIEKPFARTHAEALTMAALLRGVNVAVGYVERFNPCVRALKDSLDRMALPMRSLAAGVPSGAKVRSARFTRWNGRPSYSANLDLRSHDIDLARHLGIPLSRCTFDTLADTPFKLRQIDVELDNGVNVFVDLMKHDASPVHDQWAAFLAGAPVATMTGAVDVHAALEFGNVAVAA